MSSVLSLRPSTGSLEHELVGLLRVLDLDERQAGAVAARLGWDGGGVRTLESAATPFGYTRERVRQLEARVRRSADGWVVHALAEALDVLEQVAPDTCEHAATVLHERGLADGPFDPSGVITAAAILGVATSVRVSGGIVVGRTGDDPRAQLRRRAKALSGARGAANTNELALECRLSPARVRRLLSAVPDVEWLDGRRTWVSVPGPGPRRRTTTILRKMLAVTPALSFAAAQEGLHRSFRPVSLPASVLPGVYRTLPWLQLDVPGQTVASAVPLRADRELSRIELLLLDLFRVASRPLRYTEVVELGAPRGLNRNTVGYYLRHSPIMRSVSRGTYTLCGSAPTASSSRS
jgi:hypothetical protein